MRMESGEDGAIEFRDLDPFELDVLRRVPALLESTDPAVRERLLPSAYEDPDDEQQWRELVEPELEHLFKGRAEIVRKDLLGVSLEHDGIGFRVAIAATHRSAWESALTGASHALFLSEDLEPEDAEREPGELGDPPRDLALLRVRIMGWFLSELLEFDGYE